MTANFVPYGRQTITEEDIAAVEEVLRGPMLTQGPAVPAFEKGIARETGAKEAVVVNSATSALHIACMAMGLRNGDRLWTSPITFVASANCGRYCGAEIDFVDIDLETGHMCAEELEKKLNKASKENRLPKIIVPVHLAGTSCKMEEIWNIAQNYGIKIIEDASHAIGAYYKGKPVGNCEYSDIAVFSFHPVKIITSGEGGAACTNNEELVNRMRKLRSHGITKDKAEFETISAGPWAYEQQMLGFNYRMTDIQAALGLSQLKRLHEVVRKRNEIWDEYKQQLKSIPVKLLKIEENCRSALHLAVIRLENKNPNEHKRIFEELRKENLGVQLHYTPVHLQPYYRRMGFKPGDFPNAEKYGETAISIPMYPDLKKEEIQRVAETLEKILSRI